MEHMIGLTDTAYLGRVGEVELGASALAGVYYLVIYMLGVSRLEAVNNTAASRKRNSPPCVKTSPIRLYSPSPLRRAIST